MPHHESGLVAVKTIDPKVLDAIVAHFLKREPDHYVQVVRVDEGRGVWLCFGSVIAHSTGAHVDQSAFQDERALAGLAKKLKLPLWVGFAIGGYSNHQAATKFSASGKVEWTSSSDFSWPADLREEAEDPFTSPERHHALALELRARAGYGKISQDFGVDYFRVLDIDVGDPLFATEKRQVGTRGFVDLAEWLSGPWKNPEGNPGDGAEPSAPAEWIAWKLPNDTEAKQRLAGIITCALEHVNAPLEQATLTESRDEKSAVLVLEGPSAKVVSSLVLSMRFTEFASKLTGTELNVLRGEGDSARQVAGVSAPGSGFLISHRGGAGVKRPSKSKPLALEASAELRNAVQVLRKPEPVEEENDEEASAAGELFDLFSALAKAAVKKMKKKVSKKKPAKKTKSAPRKR